MSLHTFFCDDSKRPATVEVGRIENHHPKIAVTLSVPGASINLHMDDMAAGYRLYERLGNALQAALQEALEADMGIDLSEDAPPPAGIVGIQSGNPTMDAHGPR